MTKNALNSDILTRLESVHDVRTFTDAGLREVEHLANIAAMYDGGWQRFRELMASRFHVLLRV